VAGSWAGASPVAVQQLGKLRGLLPRQLLKTEVGNKVKSREQSLQGL